jgi:hypothetical protein
LRFANVWQNSLIFAKHWQIPKVWRAVSGEPFAKHWQNHPQFAKHWQIAPGTRLSPFSAP